MTLPLPVPANKGPSGVNVGPKEGDRADVREGKRGVKVDKPPPPQPTPPGVREGVKVRLDVGEREGRFGVEVPLPPPTPNPGLLEPNGLGEKLGKEVGEKWGVAVDKSPPILPTPGEKDTPGLEVGV